METELRTAVAEYRAQLTSLEELLSTDPDNTEVKEVHEQLQGALSYTLAALDEQQQLQLQETTDGQFAGGNVTPLADGADGGPYGSGYVDGAANTGGGATATAANNAVAEGLTGAVAASRPRGGAPNNARMHPANLYYRQEPNFAALAEKYEELRPYVSTDAAGRAHLDTSSWEATRALTACLLCHDFGVRWWLPEGQLVPPVPNRANYIHWINDLLHLSAPPPPPPPSPGGGGGGGGGDGACSVRGLDIGCGANFIYCLLGAVLYDWKMVGVDVTQVAVRCCRQHIEDNPQMAALLEIRDLSYLHPDLQGPDAAAPAGAVGPAGGRRGRKRGGATTGPDADPDSAAHAAEHQQQDRHEDKSNGDGDGNEADGVRDATGLSGKEQEAGPPAAADDAIDAVGPTGNEQGILVPAFVDDTETFAFTMCNPPFFESMQEAAQNPNTAFGGTAAEMVCPGGELAFVLRMLMESEELQDRVHWFSTMVGKKSTLKALRRELHCRHVTALRTTELAQGKTSRWAVAWSWQVDPNKASQPLRRLEAPTAVAAGIAVSEPYARAAPPAARSGRGRPVAAPSLAAAGMPLLPRRHVSFTVHQTGSLNSRNFLQEVKRLLEAEGCGQQQQLEVDAVAWTVTWPLQVGPFSAAVEGEERPAKRPREGAVEGGCSWASNIKARLRVAQQQRGRFEVVTTIPNDASDTVARAFAGVMASLELGLASCGARS